MANCLGLTLLYNCLLRKAGSRPQAVYLQDAFGIGPHVLSMLRTETITVDIEHIFVHGFDYKGHVTGAGRTVWGERELVAEVYHSRGNALFEQGRLSEALSAYDQAVDLNPRRERIRLNRTILLDRMGMNGRPSDPARYRKAIEKLLYSSTSRLPDSIARRMQKCCPVLPLEPPP